MKSGALCGTTLAGIVWALGVFGLAESSQVDNDARLNPSGLSSEQGSVNIDPQGAIAHWRQVAVRKQTTSACPQVNGWKVESVPSRDGSLCAFDFAQHGFSGNDPAGGELLRHLGLDRICLYTAQGNTIPTFRTNGQLPAGLVAAAPDRMALSPAAEPEDSLGNLALESWKILSAHFSEQAGRMPSAGRTPSTDELLRGSGPARTRLVFLDTHPTGEGLPSAFGVAEAGRSFHGYTMAHLANQLVCGGDAEGCAVEIATRLAMPYRRFDPFHPPSGDSAPDSRGGRIGLVGDLAGAIVCEVFSFRRDTRPERPKHLVLNLSLGWDGELFGDLEARYSSDLELSVWWVYQALEYARRSGVLVIAAAGNERGGPERPTSPLFPAVWELRRPRRSGLLPLPWKSSLVYAVGGVDWQGLPIANSRTGGKPRRSAYADHAVAGTEAGGTASPTWIYTGSSVATAVTSSIAAAIWYLRPELWPHQVMKLLDRSSESLTTRADFYSSWIDWFRPPRLCRLSLCRAIAHATAREADRLVCPEWRREPPRLSPPDEAVLLDFVHVTTIPAPPCASEGRLLSESPGRSSDPCPADRFGDIASQRWVFPQPENNPCMGCSLTPGGTKFRGGVRGPLYTLQMELNPKWIEENDALPEEDRFQIAAAELEIQCYDTAREAAPRKYGLPDSDLRDFAGDGGARFNFEWAEREPLWGCTARLNFKLVNENGEEASVINPVIIAEQTP